MNTHTRDIARFCESETRTTTFILPNHTHAIVRNDRGSLAIRMAEHWRAVWAAADWSFDDDQ